MLRTKPYSQQAFIEPEDSSFSEILLMNEYPEIPRVNQGIFNSFLQFSQQEKKLDQVILLDNTDCLIVHNGLVFQKSDRELIKFDLLNKLGYIHFVLQSDLIGVCLIVAASVWDLYEINLQTQKAKKLIIKDFSNDSLLQLKKHKPVAWNMSSSKRMLSILCSGSRNDYIFCIDLAYQTAIKKELPKAGFQKILYSFDDRYLGLINKCEALVTETSFYDYQIIKVQDPIKNITFEQDKFVILTQSLQLLVYRRADSILRPQANILQKIFFPQRVKEQSRVQFYLINNTKDLNIQVSDRCQTALIKIKDQLRRILLFDQGILSVAQINQVEDKISIGITQSLHLLQNLIRDLEERCDKREISQIAQDFQVEVVQDVDQIFNVIDVNIYRLHRVDDFNLLLNKKVIHI